MKLSNEERMRLLGINIKNARNKAGYTQLELSELIPLSYSFLTKIESEKVFVSINMNTCFDIADALNIEPYELLKFN